MPIFEGTVLSKMAVALSVVALPNASACTSTLPLMPSTAATAMAIIVFFIYIINSKYLIANGLCSNIKIVYYIAKII